MLPQKIAETLKAFLNQLKNLIEGALNKPGNSSVIQKNPLLSKTADQLLVFNLNKRKATGKIPQLSQLKVLPKYLSPRESKMIKNLLIVIGVCLIILFIQFYYSHTLLVPKSGGSYTEGLVGAPQYINPILASYNDVDSDLARLIFNGLLKTNDSDQLVPDLAVSFDTSVDKKTYTFKLRENVKWHDGEPFNADDVLFTVSSIQDAEWKSPLKSAFDNVQVEKLDDYTVRFILKEADRNFINLLTFGILPEHRWATIPAANATLAELNKKPVGTGPYKFNTLTKDQTGNIRQIELIANNDFYDQKPYISQLIFKFYGDFDSATDALANNNVEGLSLLPKEYQDKAAKNKSLKFYSLSLPQYTAVFFNTKKNDALKIKEVRQALAYAIDRQNILTKSLDQKGMIINSPILPGFPGYYPEVKKYDYNATAAQTLLDKAGWKKDSTGKLMSGKTPLTITLTTTDKIEYKNAAEIIKQNWEALGIATTINIVPKDRIMNDVISPRNYEALLYGQIMKADPYLFWDSSFISPTGGNLAVWANANVDKDLESARTLTDPAQITQKYQDFQNILADSVPAIFLYNPISVYPVTDKIQGLNTRRITTPADRFNEIASWYLKTAHKFYWILPQNNSLN